MAIFNNSDSTPETAKHNSNTTIITAGAKIKGEIELSCSLYIDGELDGIIKSSKDVNVGKNGHIKGSITSNSLIVQGKIEGNIDSNIVNIKAGGHVNGEIISDELIIESKAIFEGTSVMKKQTNKTDKKQAK
jgi:cytoskeletal protein CcmA (bactofilin family)